MFPPTITLLQFPQELLDDIAFYVACGDEETGKWSLIPLLQTCKCLYNSLTTSDRLFARIFQQHFSFSAVERRAFAPTSSEYAEQLRLYCRVLLAIKNRTVSEFPDSYDIEYASALEIVYYMLLDDDGRNSAYLNRVNTYDWVKEFVLTRMKKGAQHGYPLENAENALALEVLWLMTTQERLDAETDEESDVITRVILPFVVLPFRYPGAFIPPNHFHLPLNSRPYLRNDRTSVHQLTVLTRHGVYPLYRPEHGSRIYFRRRAQLTMPLISMSAKCLYFSRMARWKHQVPPHLPLTREDSVARAQARIATQLAAGIPAGAPGWDWSNGTTGPTAEDITEWNGEGTHVNPIYPGRTLLPPRKDLATTLPPDWSYFQWSKLMDPDFNRLRQAISPWGSSYYNDWRDGTGSGGPLRITTGDVYKPGMLSGLWVGPMMVPQEENYFDLLGGRPREGDIRSPPQLPTSFSEETLRVNYIPVYMQLEEHVLYAPAKPIPCGGPSPTTGPVTIASHTSEGSPDTPRLGEGRGEWEPTVTEQVSHPDHNSRTSPAPSELEETHEELRSEFDQGLLNGYLPSGIKLKHVHNTFSYPLDGSIEHIKPKAGETLEVRFSGIGPRWEGQDDVYVYQTIEGTPIGKEHASLSTSGPNIVTPNSPSPDADSDTPSSLSPISTAFSTLPPPGLFHDPTVCPGCKIREEEKVRVRQERTEYHENEKIWEDIGLGRSRSYGKEDSEDTDNSSDGSVHSSQEDIDSDPEGPEGCPAHDPYHIPPCTGVIDVLITGHTPQRHGAAWIPFKYTGRVRLHDGLIGILRECENDMRNNQPGPLVGGKVVFYGYIKGGRNFVGNWRIVGSGNVNNPGYEGPFSFGRRE